MFWFVLFGYVLLCLPQALDPTDVGAAADYTSVDADVEKVQVFCFNLV